ncbi:MAG: GNAT family N-acetyltransferase [Bacteroidales bacterium]
MAIEIRRINEHDFEALVQLIKELAEFEQKTAQMQNSTDRMQQEKNHIHGFVATDNGKIIAYAVFCRVYYTFSGKAIYLEDIYVQPAYRGTGIGSQLINKVIDLAKAEACHKVRWQVSEWNAKAIEFYKTLGVTIADGQRDCHLYL